MADKKVKPVYIDEYLFEELKEFIGKSIYSIKDFVGECIENAEQFKKFRKEKEAFIKWKREQNE